MIIIIIKNILLYFIYIIFMVQKKYLDKIDQCIEIIENNKGNPEECIRLMCKLNLVKDKNNELKCVKNIYEMLSDKSIEYDEKKYRNNITSYNKKLDSNIEKAKKYKK